MLVLDRAARRLLREAILTTVPVFYQKKKVKNDPGRNAARARSRRRPSKSVKKKDILLPCYNKFGTFHLKKKEVQMKKMSFVLRVTVPFSHFF